MPGGSKVDIATLTERAGTTFWLPKQDKQDTFTGAWFCNGGSTPFLSVDDVYVVFESGWRSPSTKTLTSMLDEGGSIGVVQGRPAALQPAVTEAGSSSKLLFMGETVVRVYGSSGISMKSLADVADSLDLDQPVSGPSVLP